MASPTPVGAPTVSTPPPAGGPAAPSPPPPSPGTSRGRGHRLVAVVASVIVVVLVVLGLGLAGVLPFLNVGSGGAVPYSTAAARSASISATYAGGGWTPVLAVAINSHASVDFGSVPNLPGCTLSHLGGMNSAIVPPVQSSVGGGLSTGWSLISRNATGAILYTAVFDGHASLFLAFSGWCAAALARFPGIPSSVVDSTAAASAANGVGGSAFLNAHPDSNGSMVVVGGVGGGPTGFAPGWSVIYSTCPINVTQAVPGFEFAATVNATTGAVEGHSTGPVTCTPGWYFSGLLGTTPAGQIPLGTVLALGTPSESPTGPTYLYNFSIEFVGGSVFANNLSFQIQTPTGAIVATNGVMALVGLSGVQLASYSMPAWAWTSGGMTPVTTADLLSLSLTVPSAGISGDQLVVSGSGQFSGSIGEIIP